MIVVVSDGGENASGTSLARLVAYASPERNAGLWHSTPSCRRRSSRRPSIGRSANFLPELVGDSGGTVYQVRSPEAGEAAARAFLEELRSQYTLGYVPKRARRRQVSTAAKSNPPIKNVVVRHRAGYLAAVRTVQIARVTGQRGPCRLLDRTTGGPVTTSKFLDP